MPFPLIPVVIGGVSALVGIFGLKKGTDGVQSMRAAKGILEQAEKSYQEAGLRLEERRGELNERVLRYLDYRVRTLSKTGSRFLSFVERNGLGGGDHKDFMALESVGLERMRLEDIRVVVLEAKSLLAASAGAVGTGATVAGATTTLIGLVGTASTGTAIGTLSGAAAQSAILAWLGGGSLAAGGGGMALGSLILGGVVVGPSLVITGFYLAGKGEEALTEAHKKQAEVEERCQQMATLCRFLESLHTRIDEIQSVAERLDEQAMSLLDHLEALPRFRISHDRHVMKFQQAAICVKGLTEILKAPVLNPEGEISDETGKLIAHLRHIAF